MWYSKDFSCHGKLFFFCQNTSWGLCDTTALPRANNDVKTPHDVKMGSRSNDRCRHFGVTCLLLVFVGGGFDSLIYSANLDGSFLSPAVSVAESCLLRCCPRHHDSTRGCDFAEPNEQIELHRRWIFIIRAAFVASIRHLIIFTLLLKSWILTPRDATKA